MATKKADARTTKRSLQSLIPAPLRLSAADIDKLDFSKTGVRVRVAAHVTAVNLVACLSWRTDHHYRPGSEYDRQPDGTLKDTRTSDQKRIENRIQKLRFDILDLSLRLGDDLAHRADLMNDVRKYKHLPRVNPRRDLRMLHATFERLASQIHPQVVAELRRGHGVR